MNYVPKNHVPMNHVPSIDRRSFVVGAATLGGGLALGLGVLDSRSAAWIIMPLWQ